MLNVTDANFSDVLEAPQAVVYFWSPTCGYCKAFTPLFEALSARYGDRALFVGANVMEAQKAAGSYNLTGVPTVLFMKNGQVVRRADGAMSEQDFIGEFGRAFGEAGAPAEVPAGGLGIDLGILPSLLALAGVGAGVYYLLDL